jgi:P27 family predicted phage terminase small subunit
MSRPPSEVSPSGSPRWRPTRAKEHVPTATEGRPACPKFLSKEEKQRFKQMVRGLESRRQCTNDDGELLTLYVTSWSRWRRAMKDVTDRGAIVKVIARGKNDEVIEREKPNPYLAIATQAEKTMIACLDRLGFTPLNRERCKPVKREEKNIPFAVGSVGWILEQAKLKDEGKDHAN